MNLLKPCPFCGGKAALCGAKTPEGDHTFSVICQNCNTGIFKANYEPNEWVAFDNTPDAINAWNRRTKYGK